VELSGVWHAHSRWTVSGNLTASNDHFIDFTEFDFEGNALNRDGNREPLFPALMGNLRLSYQWGPAWLSARLRSVGRQYLDSSEDERKSPAAHSAPGYVPKVLDPYTSLDLIARVSLEDWLGAVGRGLEAYVQVSNVFDARYETFGYLDFEPVFIPAASRNFFLGLRWRK
jgi:outer membrane receptor protein involved in Fe transport